MLWLNKIKTYLFILGRLFIVSLVFLLVSCKEKKSISIRHYDYSFRIEEISNPDIQLTPVVVDLCIDFDKIVSATSDWKLTKEEAIDGAQFLALKNDSSTHVLIAPIFAITEETEIIDNKKQSTLYQAEVIGFSGQYCAQYSLIEALNNVSSNSISNIKKMEMLEGNFHPWTTDPFYVGQIYSSINDSNSISPRVVNNSIDSTFHSQQINSVSDTSNKKIENAPLIQTSENKSISENRLTEIQENQNSSQNKVQAIQVLKIQDSIQTPIATQLENALKEKIETRNLPVDQNSNSKFVTLDEQVIKLYSESILRDSAEKLIKNGKSQMDFILHNDDYISRWMKENEALKKQLVMFLRIQENETSFIDLKYKTKRSQAEDLEWGKIDYYLLELEYLNKNKLLFYSNFNLLRSKKLVEDCFQNANDSTRRIVQKYVDIANNWLSEGNIPMQINSTDELLLKGLPLRKKINAEYFASEIFYRAWEICQGKKLDFLSDTLNWKNQLLGDSAKWQAPDSPQAYALKNKNSSTFEETTYPKGSYLELMQMAMNLPDTLKKPVFATFPNTKFPEDFEFPSNIKYPSGIIYVVQVGAFRKKIEPELFRKFSPVVKEAKGDGVYRYTAGFFPKFGSAQIALRQIKQMGFKDAYIVALQDGVRIPLPPKTVRIR
jgi:hypothetical protein